MRGSQLFVYISFAVNTLMHVLLLLPWAVPSQAGGGGSSERTTAPEAPF